MSQVDGTLLAIRPIRNATAPPTLNRHRRLMKETTKARSAVVFRGDLYAILSSCFSSDVCFLMKYDCEKDTWTVIRDDAVYHVRERSWQSQAQLQFP
jgi:hypothetical protein